MAKKRGRLVTLTNQQSRCPALWGWNTSQSNKLIRIGGGGENTHATRRGARIYRGRLSRKRYKEGINSRRERASSRRKGKAREVKCWLFCCRPCHIVVYCGFMCRHTIWGYLRVWERHEFVFTDDEESVKQTPSPFPWSPCPVAGLRAHTLQPLHLYWIRFGRPPRKSFEHLGSD